MESRGELIGVVRGTNANGASSNLTFPVIVLPMGFNTLEYHSLILSVTTSSSFFATTGLTSTDWILSTGVTSLNRINNSCENNCSTLNRHSCHTSSQIPHTCGRCLPGYFADDFLLESNTPCIDPLSLLSSSQSQQQQQLQKQCSNECSSHGSCLYVSRITKEQLTECNLFDPNCEPVCFCSSRYAKTDCSMTQSEFQLKLSSRKLLLTTLTGTGTGTGTGLGILENLETYLTLVHELVRFQDELDTVSCTSLFQIIWEIFSKISNDLSIPYDDFLKLSSVVFGNTCVDLLPSESLDLLSQYLELLVDHMLPLEVPIEIIETRYRVMIDRQQLLTTPLTLPLIYRMPQTPLEQLLSVNQIVITFSPSAPLPSSLPLSPLSLSSVSLSVSDSDSDAMILSQVSLIPNSLLTKYLPIGTFLTNPIRIQIQSSTPWKFPRKFVVVNVTRSSSSTADATSAAAGTSGSRGATSGQELFSTMCKKHKIESTLHICQNKYAIHHYCDGIFNGILTTLCPERRIRPHCGVITSSSSSTDLGTSTVTSLGSNFNVNANVNWTLDKTDNLCQVIAFDNQTISCQCNLSPLLSPPLVSSPVISVLSLEVIPYESYGYSSPSTTALDLPGDFLDSVIIVILFMFLWFTILAIGFLCHYVDTPPSKSYSVSNSNISANHACQTNNGLGRAPSRGPPRAGNAISQRRRRGGRKSCPSGSLAAYAYVLKYIDKTIPFVFRPKKSLTKHFSFAIFQHHRYLRIFTTSSGGRSQLRIIQMFHFLTVQSFVLFVLWIILDHQVTRSSFLLQSSSSSPNSSLLFLAPLALSLSLPPLLVLLICVVPILLSDLMQ
jgi:hypothetical protein